MCVARRHSAGKVELVFGDDRFVAPLYYDRWETTFGILPPDDESWVTLVVDDLEDGAVGPLFALGVLFVHRFWRRDAVRVQAMTYISVAPSGDGLTEDAPDDGGGHWIDYEDVVEGLIVHVLDFL